MSISRGFLVLFLACALFAPLAPAATAPVKLTTYPQRTRTFHAFTDPAVPAGLRAASFAPCMDALAMALIGRSTAMLRF
jgi:hypothetical protein